MVKCYSFLLVLWLAISLKAVVIPDSPKAITQRLATLVLYKEKTDLVLVRNILDGYATIYKATTLLPNLSRPDFHSIIITSSEFNLGDWAAIRKYAAQYNVRIVFLHSDPDGIPGVHSVNHEVTYLTMDQDSYSKNISDVVCDTCFWDAQSARLNCQPALITDKLSVMPIMRFTNDRRTPTDTSDVAAVTVKDKQTGVEEMHFFFNAAAHELRPDGNPKFIQYSQFTKLNIALGNVWFQWSTKGVYVGLRRIYMQMHVDDWFSSTEEYETERPIRITGKDVEFAAKFTDNLAENLNLPFGSRIYFELAFNGGYYRSADEDNPDSLETVSNRLRNKFHWISHTFTHQNLDYLEPDQCNGRENSCPTEPLRVEEEIKFNVRVALGEGVDPSQFRSSIKFFDYKTIRPGTLYYNDSVGYKYHYSPSCLVTPQISGIWPGDVTPKPKFRPKPVPGNYGTVKALFSQGIHTVTGDNSRKELVSRVNPYHGIWMCPTAYGIGCSPGSDGTIRGILIIPRHATNVFYNVHSIESFMKMYTTIEACDWGEGSPCNDQSYTFAKVILRESRASSQRLMIYRPDPFMFHQANMKTFTYKGHTASLLSIWAEATINELRNYISRLPIISPTMEFIGQYYRDRMQRDNCGIQAYLVKDSNGNPTHLKVRTDGICKPIISVSSLLAFNANLQSESNVTTPEVYGKDISYTIAMNSLEEVIIPLKGSEASTDSNTKTASLPSTTHVVDQTSSTRPNSQSDPVTNLKQHGKRTNTDKISIGVGAIAGIIGLILGVIGIVRYRNSRGVSGKKAVANSMM